MNTQTKVTSRETGLIPIFDEDSLVETIIHISIQVHSNQLIYTWPSMMEPFNRMDSVTTRSIVVVLHLDSYQVNLLIVQMPMLLVHFVLKKKMLVPTITSMLMIIMLS